MRKLVLMIVSIFCVFGLVLSRLELRAAGKITAKNMARVATAPHLSHLRGPIFLTPASGTTTWSMPELCAAYNFPTGLKGGSVIGIAEFGGGYLLSDLALFSKTYMNNTPINIQAISVDGTQNSPGIDFGADAEVTLDIEIAAAAYYYCTGKAPTVKVFFAATGFTDDQFVDSISSVITASATARCDVLSISWGTTEDAIANVSTAIALESAATAATAKGMAIFAASGDGNATNERQGETDGRNHVILPSSCPHVIAVGGTTKTATTEVVWNNGLQLGTPYPLGTGGGYSILFPTQAFQFGAPVAPFNNNGRGRMTPDVAANADPLTPYNIALDGVIQAAGNGTSAATPLWAGLVASIGTKPGNVNPKLWLTKNRFAFGDIKSGNNGLFTATAGPDACTGLGVPIGTAINAVLLPPVPPAPNDVTVTYSGGTLTVTGDALSNSLTISVQARVLKIQGANATTINHQTSVNFNLTGDLVLSVDLSDGDDAISFVGVQSSTATVNLGAGADKAAFTLCNIKNLTVDGSQGVDLLIKASSTFGTMNSSNFP